MSNETEVRQVPAVRRVVVVVVALVAALQLFGVTFISIPPQSAPPGTRAAAEIVLHSYFEEEWKLFAPSPINADRDLMVQAAWRDGDAIVAGEWVDLTAIDDSLVQHSIGAPRSAYLTSRIAGNTDAAWSGVPEQARTAVLDAATETQPLATDDLTAVLEQEGVAPVTVDYIRDIDLATTTYVTDALRSLEPDRELVAVRYGVQVSTAPSWEQRAKAEKSVAEIVAYAWRVPVADDPDRREVVGAFLERNS